MRLLFSYLLIIFFVNFNPYLHSFFTGISKSVHAQVFDEGINLSWGYLDSNQYRLISKERQTISFQGSDPFNEVNTYNILYKISEQGNSYYISSDTEIVSNGELLQSLESQYFQDQSGRLEISDEFLTPTLRGVPTFPSNTLFLGNSWQASAYDTIISPNDNSKFIVPVSVSYEYLGFFELPKEEILTSIEKYHREFELTNSYPKIRARYGYDDFQYLDARGISWSVNGEFLIDFWWHLENKRPFFQKEDYFLIFESFLGDRFIIEGQVEGHLFPVINREFQNDEARLQQELTQKLDNVRVDVKDDGITITLENIQFMPDSSELLKAEQEKIRRIAEILRTYSDKRLLVEGHAARAGIPAEQRRISIERAEVVHDLLKRILQRDNEEILYRGYGAEKPIDSNSTQEGRKRNRRVEIKILQN